MDAVRHTASDDDVMSALQAHLEDFRKLYQLGLDQRDAIAREDLATLERSFVCMHALMGSIRLRQDQVFAADDIGTEVRAKRTELCELIRKTDAVRQQNQAVVQSQMAATHRELMRLGRRRKAARRYSRPNLGRSNLVDGRR